MTFGELVLIAAIGGVIVAIIIGLTKLIWFLTKRQHEKNKVRNAERRRFRTDFDRLARDTQKLRQPQTISSPERLALSRINGFANDLIRAKKYLKPSVRQIANETIATARNDYLKPGNVGDEFVDYLELQYQKALKKKWGEE